MFMFDLTAELQSFYDTHVRLGTDRRKQLGEYRDLNIARLKGGLDDLAAETRRSRPHPYARKNQGGYAMHTLNQDPGGDNGYDIDIALLFGKDDLPEDPLRARQRVCEALHQIHEGARGANQRGDCLVRGRLSHLLRSLPHLHRRVWP